jgi:hypothetical protein
MDEFNVYVQKRRKETKEKEIELREKVRELINPNKCKSLEEYERVLRMFEHVVELLITSKEDDPSQEFDIIRAMHNYVDSPYVLSLLLTLGCDPDSSNYRLEWTPLLPLCAHSWKNSSFESAKLLLEHGANGNCISRGTRGISALDCFLRPDPIYSRFVKPDWMLDLKTILLFSKYGIKRTLPMKDVRHEVVNTLQGIETILCLCIPITLPRCKQSIWISTDGLMMLASFLLRLS